MDGALVGMLVSSSFVTVFYYPYFWIQCLLVSCLYGATVDRFPPVAAVTQRKRPLSPVRSTAAREQLAWTGTVSGQGTISPRT